MIHLLLGPISYSHPLCIYSHRRTSLPTTWPSPPFLRIWTLPCHRINMKTLILPRSFGRRLLYKGRGRSCLLEIWFVSRRDLSHSHFFHLWIWLWLSHPVFLLRSLTINYPIAFHILKNVYTACSWLSYSTLYFEATHARLLCRFPRSWRWIGNMTADWKSNLLDGRLYNYIHSRRDVE